MDVVTCQSCGNENPERAKFCLECGARVKVDAGERRVLTVLFADLSGFTSYSERVDPEEANRLAREAASLGEFVERYGGTVDKYIGDCVMAVFGAPTSHEDDPERAVRCAIDMNRHVTEHPDKFCGLPLRIGVNTGEAMWGPIGPQGEYTVIGDSVNTAARLQSAAPRGEILVGEDTWRSAIETVDMVEVDSIAAKGKDKPVPAWRVLGVRGVRERTTRRTPFVGRKGELGRLVELWDRVRSENKQYAVSVIGAPGVGKTRLISTFTEKIAGSADVVIGRCLSYGEGITYWPVVEMIKAAAGIMHDDSTPAVQAKLGILLESLGIDDLDQLRTIAVALANLVAVPTTPRGTYQAGEISQGELHWGLRRLVELRAERRPIVLMFEDIHWAEPALLKLIDSFVDSSRDAPILVVCLGRPEFHEVDTPLVSPDLRRRVIDLAPLPAADSEELLRSLLGRAAEGGDLERLLRGASGNPLYIEEISRMLAEEGFLDDEGQLRADVSEFPVPATLRSLLDARLDRLEEREKQIAGQASVVGNVFWSGAVAHLDGEAKPVEPGLESLEDHGFVHENTPSTLAGEREFMFQHLMVRDVAYGRIPKEKRAELHERCGAWIAGMPGGADEFVEFVAYHYEQSCLLVRDLAHSGFAPPVLPAAHALKEAGYKAISRQGMREAERFFQRAVDLLGDGYPETTIEIEFHRARAQLGLGQWQEAMDALERIAEQAGAFGRIDVRANALIQIGNIESVVGTNPARGRAALDEAKTLVRDFEERRLIVLAGLSSGTLRAVHEGEPDQGIREARLALELAEREGLYEDTAEGHARIGTMLFNFGDLAGAEAEFRHCAEIARQLGGVRWEAVATRFLGTIAYYAGPRDDAERLSRQTLEWLERLGDPLSEIQTRKRLALIAMSESDLDRAETGLRRALALARKVGAALLIVDVLRTYVEVLTLRGRIEEARMSADEAHESAPDHPYARASALIAQGLVDAASEHGPAARAAFDDAIAALEAIHLPFDLAEVRLTYAHVLSGLGDEQEAREQLLQARATFEERGATAMLEEIDQSLAALERTA